MNNTQEEAATVCRSHRRKEHLLEEEIAVYLYSVGVLGSTCNYYCSSSSLGLNLHLGGRTHPYLLTVENTR